MSADLGLRLREERQRLGLDQVAFGELGGVKKNTQIAYEKGETSPSAAYLIKLEGHGVDATYVLTGQHAGTSTEPPNDDVVEVEEIDLVYGLGGTYADGPVEVRFHRIARSFVESITSTPAKLLTIARGLGDSMAPTLMDGDMVIIDRSQRNVREQDAIWAMTIGDIAMIKRLRIRGERVMILSDNERVPLDEAHHEEIRIVGRVIACVQ